MMLAGGKFDACMFVGGVLEPTGSCMTCAEFLRVGSGDKEGGVRWGMECSKSSVRSTCS